MGKLPIECEPFIFSISTLSPREKILAVEDFLAQTWYADIHNDKEWSTQKATKDPEIQMQMCMDRITYLQVHYPNDALFLKHKLFAGVCHDIQVMRLMMHRKL